MLLQGGDISPWAEAALFAAARAELVAEVIRPALERGADVVCDRYLDSSLAYQGIARGLGDQAIWSSTSTSIGGLMPDRTFVLLLDPAAAATDRRAPRPDRARRRGLPRLARRPIPRARPIFPERIVPLDARTRPTRSRRRVRDQLPRDRFARAQARGGQRLLDAALREGPAHAYLFHGPPGVGKRARRSPSPGSCSATPTASSAGRIPTSTCSSRSATRSGSTRSASSAARPAHAAVRGRPARLPRPRRAHAERGGRRRAAQGSRGAAGVRRPRARGGRARPAAGDDPLALPARSVPPAVRAAVREEVAARAPALADESNGPRAGRRRPARPRRPAARPEGGRAARAAARRRAGRLPGSGVRARRDAAEC